MPNLVYIADDDELYKRIAPDHFYPDGNVNSAAFKVRGAPDTSISVDLARLTTPFQTLARAPRPGFGLGTLMARVPRAMGFSVEHDPLPDNMAHSLISGANDKRKCKLLAEATRVLIPAQQQPSPS